MIHDACTVHTSSQLLEKNNSSGIDGGIHMCSLYLKLISLHVLC